LTDLAALTRLIEPEATALGFDLVRVKLFGKGDERTLQIMAERPDTRQLTIDDCAELSRRVSDVLDAEEAAGRDPIAEAYRLEVSSPGIDRPLTRLKDYTDWQSHEARVTLAEKQDGQRTFKGDLAGIEGESVLIRAANGTVSALPFVQIEDAKLVFTDRLLAATAPLSSAGADEFIEAPVDGADEHVESEDDASDETQEEETN
jgi:ribosome maturation factor RimP